LIVNTNGASEGRLGVLLALPAGQNLEAGARELVRATFRIAANAAGGSAITFADEPVAREIVSADVEILAAQFTSGTVAIGETRPVLGGAGLGRFTITGIAGRSYRIEFTESPEAAAWQSAETIRLGESPQLWIDRTEPLGTRRFYRVVEVNAP
jgi:hypothetical protein